MNGNTNKVQIIKIGLISAVIGVIAGTVGTLLADKKKRQQIVDSIEELKRWSDRKIDALKEKVEDVKREADEKLKTLEEHSEQELQDLRKSAKD